MYNISSTNLFLSINQSKRSLKIDEDFQIHAQIVHKHIGKGKIKNILSNKTKNYSQRIKETGSILKDFTVNKNSVLQIKNDDNFCLIYALIIAKAKLVVLSKRQTKKARYMGFHLTQFRSNW